MVESLVIGANGFLGSHLVDTLSANGHAVTAFDRFSSGAPRFQAPASILVGDFLSDQDLRAAVEGKDYVFHFLSTTTPASTVENPTLDVASNITQSVQLLSFCVGAGVKRFYFASTGGAIYGNQNLEVFSERAATLPVSPYAIAKQAVESYLRYYRAVHHLDSTVFRISNPYGPRQLASKGQGLIPMALARILAGKQVTQFGDGSMVRDYIYVDDLMARIMALVQAEQPRHDTYNLGSGSGHTVAEVIEAIGSVAGRPYTLDILPAPATFVPKVILDTLRFDEEFGSLSITSLVEGLSLTYAAFGEA